MTETILGLIIFAGWTITVLILIGLVVNNMMKGSRKSDERELNKQFRERQEETLKLVIDQADARYLKCKKLENRIKALEEWLEKSQPANSLKWWSPVPGASSIKKSTINKHETYGEDKPDKG